MGWLAAALAAPIAGPLLYRVLHGRPRERALVDGFVYLAVPLLVALQVVPHAWEERSLVTIGAVVAGFLLPTAAERLSHALAERTDDAAIVVGISGLVLHAMLEGAALVPAPDPPDAPFALAVTLHRIPVSLIIWWLIRPRFGPGLASVGVASLVLATLGGWLLGAELVAGGHSAGVELYQAFVSGSLVHVVFHQGRHDHAHGHSGEHGHAHPGGSGPND